MLIDSPSLRCRSFAWAIANGTDGIPVEGFSCHAELVVRLQEFVEESGLLLFKASHLVELDRVVNQFRSNFIDFDRIFINKR